MSQPSLVIFDCDGVLIDSEGLANQCFVETLASYKIHTTLEDVMKRYVGRSEADTIADIELRYKIKLPDDFWKKDRAHRTKLFEKNLKAIPGVFELIDGLCLKKCVASSSAPETLRHSLSLVGLWDYFAPHIFSATQVKHGKPAPDLFLFAAAQMQVDPSDCLVIEDSPAGVQAAKAAGMRVYGFIGGSHCNATHGERLLREGAERIFTNMGDLAGALAPIAA